MVTICFICSLSGLVTLRPSVNSLCSLAPNPKSNCRLRGSRPSVTFQKWSGRRDSNPRRQPWEGCILPLNYFRNMSEFTTNKFYLQYIIYSASCFFMLSPKSSKEPRVTTSSPALTPEITSVY